MNSSLLLVPHHRLRRILKRGENYSFLSYASLWWLGCLPDSYTQVGICVGSGKGRVVSDYPTALPRTVLCSHSCGSPTSSTLRELPPGRLQGPAPPRLRAREGAGWRRADTWRPQWGRAEGKRRLGLAGAARGRREGEGGETVVGLVLVLEPGRPEGRGSAGGRKTAAAWRPGTSRPTLFPAVAAGVVGTL